MQISTLKLPTLKNLTNKIMYQLHISLLTILSYWAAFSFAIGILGWMLFRVNKRERYEPIDSDEEVPNVYHISKSEEYDLSDRLDEFEKQIGA
jgi:hypothetical protein